MSRQTILISSLGESPAVVTEAIDKLEEAEGIRFTQVVTLGTDESEVRQGCAILNEHMVDHYADRSIVYLHEAIGATDVLTEKDNLDYLALVAKWLKTSKHLGDVYVSLAGGRKTMSALMALAVQIYGAKLLCHVVHLQMSDSLQRDMNAANLSRNREEWETLLHPASEEIELVRLPVISLFPWINDFLRALGGQEVDKLDAPVRTLLEDNHLVERQGGGWRVTASGRQLHDILNDIQLLPDPSAIAPQDKVVHLSSTHHGNEQLRPHAERLRNFPFAERMDSTDNNPACDRSRALKTKYGNLVVDVKTSAPEVLRVTLAYTDAGYALEVRTRAQSMSQAERVKRELERFLIG
ncbi:MAG: hypothetical protein HONDAALG_02304 [Gammaproteobacteria bacterium]|nr:hypothetical protein [Gammaproteobacteria bacterium]